MLMNKERPITIILAAALLAVFLVPWIPSSTSAFAGSATPAVVEMGQHAQFVPVREHEGRWDHDRDWHRHRDWDRDRHWSHHHHRYRDFDDYWAPGYYYSVPYYGYYYSY